MNNLLIWGTGKLAELFIKNQFDGEITGFIETNKSRDMFMNKPVYDSRNIPQDYDYIIIANSHATDIFTWCQETGIDTSKMIFLYGVRQRPGYTDKTILRKLLSEKNYALYCSEFGLTEDTFVQSDAALYQQLNQRELFAIQEKYMWPVISDKYASAGAIGNYFWQDLWAAKLVIKSGVKEHFDIGSRLDGFIAHLLAAGIDVTMIDIRAFPSEVEHLHTIVDDATNLHQIPDGSLGSISALCSLEHFGLGRYGDPIDPEACFKCL